MAAVMDPEHVNWTVPNIQMVCKGRPMTLHEALKNKRGIIFGVPGAFTPVCTQRHVPGYRDCLPYLQEAVQYIACVAVNDPFVLKAWAKEVKMPKEIVMIADWEGKFTKALGLEMDATSFHMGTRCRRFCILVSEGTVVWYGLEHDSYVDKVAAVLHHLGILSDEALKNINETVAKIEEEAAANAQPATDDPSGADREVSGHNDHHQYESEEDRREASDFARDERPYWEEGVTESQASSQQWMTERTMPQCADDHDMSPVEEENDDCTEDLDSEDTEHGYEDPPVAHSDEDEPENLSSVEDESENSYR